MKKNRKKLGGFFNKWKICFPCILKNNEGCPAFSFKKEVGNEKKGPSDLPRDKKCKFIIREEEIFAAKKAAEVERKFRNKCDKCSKKGTCVEGKTAIHNSSFCKERDFIEQDPIQKTLDNFIIFSLAK